MVIIVMVTVKELVGTSNQSWTLDQFESGAFSLVFFTISITCSNIVGSWAVLIKCLVFWLINCLDLVGMFFSAFVILSKVVVFVNDGSSIINFPMVVLRHLLRFDLGLFLVVFTFISCEGVSMVH